MAAGPALRAVASLAVAVLGSAAAMPASAQGTAGGWQIELSPYLWTTGLNGSVKTPTLPSTDVDVSFSDLFEVLDLGVSAGFEARNGKWGLLVDAQYYKLSPGGSAAGTGPLGNPVTVSVDAEVKQQIVAGAVAYRVSDGNVPVDVIGGLRYTKLDVEANADWAALGLTGSSSLGGDKSWTDPYVGVQVKVPLSDRWTATGYLDVGGFGAGSDSTWQAQAGFEYRFSQKYAMKFGYRVLDVDYDKDGYVYDVKTDGVYLGMGIRF